MPKIATYGDSRVGTDVISQPTFSSQGPFDGGIARGLSDLSGAIGGMKERIDTTVAEEALVNFERDKNELFFNPDSGYFNTQGRNAFDGAQGTGAALEELRKKYSDGIESQGAKDMFGKAAGAHITRGNADIMRHSAKGARAWEVATASAQVENSLEASSLYWNQPQAIKEQNMVGRLAVLDAAELAGIGSEATAERLQTFESSFARSTITAATSSSAADGQAAMDKYGDRLEGPDKVKLDKMIEDTTRVEKTRADASLAIATATRLVGQYDDRTDILAEVNKIKDDDLRKKTLAEANSQFSRKRQAESEFQGDAYDDAEGHIIDGGTAESYKVSDPQGWDALSSKQKASIQGGKAVVTDWVQFSGLMTLPKEELAKINPVEHFTNLAPAERSKLITAVKGAQGKSSGTEKAESRLGQTRSAEVTAAVNHLFGTPAKQDYDQVNTYRALMNDEHESRKMIKGSELTPSEFTDMVSDITAGAVKSGRFFGTNPVRNEELFDEDVRDHAGLLRGINFPVTSQSLVNMQELLLEFERRGTQLTLSTLEQAYEQAYRE